MKLLQIDCTFILPDDFKGSVADALRELAAYLDTSPAGKDHADSDARFVRLQEDTKELGELRYELLEVARQENHRMVGDGNVVIWNGEAWEQVTIPPTPKP